MASDLTQSCSDAVLKEFGADYGGRLKGVTVVKPIVIGSVATAFGKKRESDGHTHSWTIYIKPFPNEDYSKFIKKVQFKLHDSYEEPRRIVSEPPFQVSETGWGEFEVPIKIFFEDPTERPVTVHHSLKLFASTDGEETQALSITTKNKSVTAESYDEIVFQEPTKYLKSLLDDLKPITDGPYVHATDFEASIKDGAKRIAEAREKVRAEIEELKAKLQLSKATVESFSAKLEDQAANSCGDKTKKKKTPKKVTSPGPQQPSTLSPAKASTPMKN